MGNLSWNNDLSILLIETYKTFPCLWDPTELKYKDRNAKCDAWFQISEIVGAKEAEVKKKIKTLITQFFRERRREREGNKSGSGAADTFISKWFGYKYLLFLADKNAPRRCTEKGLSSSSANEQDMSNTSDTENEQPDSPLSTVLDDCNEINLLQTCDIQYSDDSATSVSVVPVNHYVRTLNQDHPYTELTNESQPEPSILEHYKRNKDFKSPKKSVRRRKKYSEVSEADIQQEAYAVLQEVRNRKPRNRFHVFGEHVALKIESLHTVHAQNTVEHLISNILWEASMGKYDDPPKLNCFRYEQPSTPQSSSLSAPVSPQYSSSESTSTPCTPTSSYTIPPISVQEDDEYQFEQTQVDCTVITGTDDSRFEV